MQPTPLKIKGVVLTTRSQRLKLLL